MKKNLFMKVIMFAFCCIAGGFLSQGIVKADVIWMPDDEFFNEYQSDCKYVNRQYTVNSADGYVTAYESPISDVKTGTYENGTTLWIYYTYEDDNGVVWGLDSASEYNWMPMAEMDLVYDSKEFCKDHADELISYDDRCSEDTVEQNVVLWKYPNSGEQVSIMNVRLSHLYFQYIYEDENGNVWCYVPYYCCQHGWVCINDPESTEIAGTPETTETVVTPETPETTETAVTEEPVQTTAPSDVSFVYSTVSSWDGGFMGKIELTNNTEDPINGWNLTFDCPNEILNLWSASYLGQEDGIVSVANPDWDAVLSPGETQTIDFTASGDSSEEPSNFVFSQK